MIKMYDANDNYGMGAGADPQSAQMLDAMGYSPAARQRRHDENMSILGAAAMGAMVGAGIDAWRNSRAPQATPQGQQTTPENAPQSVPTQHRHISAGWVLAGLFIAVYILVHVFS